MSEHKEPIPSRIYNAAVGGHICGTEDIIDDALGKTQKGINSDMMSTIGTGGTVDERIATETQRATAAEEELRTLYNNLQQSQPIPVTALPATGEDGKIYRLAGESSYTDYMWNGTQFIKMAEYDNAIDNEPTIGSDNLVKSGGVYEATHYKETITKNIALEHSGGMVDTYIDKNGVIKPSPKYYLSDYYNCVPGTTITYLLYGAANAVLLISFYDKNKNLLLNDSVLSTDAPPQSGTVTVPQNAFYLKWCHNTAYTGTPNCTCTINIYTPINSNEQSSGFSYTAFGDSISSDEQGNHADGLAYTRTLSMLLNANLDRFTQPGAGVQYVKTNVVNSVQDSLLATIMIGINDLNNLELGDVETVLSKTIQQLEEDTTFLGMYLYSIRTLKSRLNNNNSLICCISPCTNYIYDSPINVEPSGPQHEGYLALQAMRNGICELTRRLGGANAGYFYINGREILPWDAIYFINTNNQPDSTHPNSMGEAIMAKNIFNRLPDIKLFVTRK